MDPREMTYVHVSNTAICLLLKIEHRLHTGKSHVCTTQHSTTGIYNTVPFNNKPCFGSFCVLMLCLLK